MGGLFPELDLINNATVLQLQQSYTPLSINAALKFHAAELCYLPCFKKRLSRADRLRLMHSTEPITVIWRITSQFSSIGAVVTKTWDRTEPGRDLTKTRESGTELRT